ncbi:MAG TPA: hypothetical protein DIW81_30360 [Planctomycetaceae bacterium]|nr:hypothetical protein [Planctomycetaceae bacterium]
MDVDKRNYLNRRWTRMDADKKQLTSIVSIRFISNANRKSTDLTIRSLEPLQVTNDIRVYLRFKMYVHKGLGLNHGWTRICTDEKQLTSDTRKIFFLMLS